MGSRNVIAPHGTKASIGMSSVEKKGSFNRVAKSHRGAAFSSSGVH
jgi:hypothetical protein